MLEKYKESQKGFYDYIMSAFDSGRLSHAYLIETNGVFYAENLVMDFIKFLICNNSYDEKVCSLIDNNNYFGFFRFDCSSEIKKDMILDLKKLFSYKSYDDKKMVYLIDDASKLNKFSANSLLKFLEEPEENIVAVFLVDNLSTVIDTIVSRCQIISLLNDSILNFDSLIYPTYDGDEDFDVYIERCKERCLHFYNSFEQCGYSVSSNFDIYDFDDILFEFLVFGFFYYSDILDIVVGRKSCSDILDENITEIVVKKNSVDDIIFKLGVINDFLFNLRYNVNRNLYIDNFIISLGGM
ncbi:MAG: hypothetical protein Q4C29_00235 [bacterium]|nr:hypothetical protein [bacterium]